MFKKLVIMTPYDDSDTYLIYVASQQTVQNELQAISCNES